MKNKIKVLIFLNHQSDKKNACTLYRNIIPFKYSKLFDVRYVDKVETEIDYNPVKRIVNNINIKASDIEWADIVVFTRHYDQIALMGCLSEIANKMGKIVVYETDDLLQKVGENFGKLDLLKTEELKKIKDQLRFVDYVIKNCDLITVSTEKLKEFYSKKTKSKVVVLPNYYDYKMWRGMYQYKKFRDFIRKKIKRDNTFRIGWQGGNNHFMNNFKYIVEPLNIIKKKYKDKVQVVILSGQDPRIDYYGNRKDFFDFDFEWHQGVSINKFPKALAEIDIDLGLIVVEDNDFSRAKSNIKWMEYSLLGIPSIASKVEPYLNTNALLVNNNTDEWVSAIEEMIENKNKYDIISKEAREMVKSYNIKDNF